MSRYKYMRIRFNKIPQDIINAYKLENPAHDSHVYMEFWKGMPVLKQAGRIAQDRLINHLAKYGYAPVAHTPSLWKQRIRNIAFTLVVDNFGIKYVGKNHLSHLLNAIHNLYTVTVNMTGSKYLGLTLEYYTDGIVYISMPGYIKTALHKFQHPLPRRKQYAPHQWKPPQYGQRVQFANDNNNSPQLSETAKMHVPQIVGTLLYYLISLNFTMLPALGNLASQQANPTKQTMSNITWLLDYCATLPEAKLKYIKSDMVLWTASDASYLSEPKARSQAGGWFFLSDKCDNPHQNPTK